MWISTLLPLLLTTTLSQAGHVPFRNSKLTYLLEGDLKGDSKVAAGLRVIGIGALYHFSLQEIVFAYFVFGFG